MNSISQVLHTKNKLAYNRQGGIIVHRNAALIINLIMMNDNIVI